MDNFYDWSDEAVAPLGPPKTEQAERIAAEVAEFLAAGGVMQKVADNPIPEMVGAVSTIKSKYPTEEGMTKATPTE